MKCIFTITHVTSMRFTFPCQIALLRIGMTDPDRSTGVLLTQDEVMAALATPLPSELLLKGTVANEVSQMENKLEDKV